MSPYRPTGIRIALPVGVLAGWTACWSGPGPAPTEAAAQEALAPDGPWAATHVRIAHTADRSADRRRADQLEARLAAGESLEDLARCCSDDPSGRRGGALGTFVADVYDPAFEDAVARLPVGGTARVETGDGTHLVRRDPVVRTRVSHLVVCWQGARACRATRTRAEAESQVARAEQELSEGVPFSEVAARWSDAETRDAGGDLGFVGPLTLPPPLQEALQRLEPGAVSDPIDAPTGLHLLQRAP